MSEIPDPKPTLDAFAATLKGLSQALKRQGKEVLLLPANGPLFTELASIIGQIEAVATPIQRKRKPPR